MASAQVVETSVTNNSPSQDSNHPDDLFQSRYVIPGFKPFSQLLHVIIMGGPTSFRTMAINSNSSNDLWDEIGLCHLLRKLLQQVAGIMFGVRMLAVLKRKKRNELQ